MRNLVLDLVMFCSVVFLVTACGRDNTLFTRWQQQEGKMTLDLSKGEFGSFVAYWILVGGNACSSNVVISGNNKSATAIIGATVNETGDSTVFTQCQAIKGVYTLSQDQNGILTACKAPVVVGGAFPMGSPPTTTETCWTFGRQLSQ